MYCKPPIAPPKTLTGLPKQRIPILPGKDPADVDIIAIPNIKEPRQDGTDLPDSTATIHHCCDHSMSVSRAYEPHFFCEGLKKCQDSIASNVWVLGMIQVGFSLAIATIRIPSNHVQALLLHPLRSAHAVGDSQKAAFLLDSQTDL